MTRIGTRRWTTPLLALSLCSPVAAVDWEAIERAAELGDADAQITMGYAYLEEDDALLGDDDDEIAQDYVQAYFWLSVGIANHSSPPGSDTYEVDFDNLEDLTQVMTERQFEEGRRLVRRWRGNTTTTESSVAIGTFRVKGGISLNARSGPGTQHAVVNTLRPGTVVEELERLGNWSRLRLPDGRVAFASNRYLVSTTVVGQPTPPPAAPSARSWTIFPQLGHSSPILSIAFSPSARMLVTTSLDNTTRLWDAASGRELRLLKGHSERVFGASFSPDGRNVATGAGDGTIRLWDASTGRQLALFDAQGIQVNAIAFSPNGHTLATGLGNGTARLWDIATAREVLRLEGHSDRIFDVAFSPNGRTLATASQDGTARLWDRSTGRALSVLQGHNNHVVAVAFSPQSDMVATGSQDGTARIWDVRSGQERLVLAGHSSYVSALAFSSDGRTLATGAGRGDGNVRMWDVETGRERRVIKGHSDEVYSFAFSPGLKNVASIYERTVRLSEVTSGREFQILDGHLSHVENVFLGADSGSLATLSRDNTIQLWDLRQGRKIGLLESGPQDIKSLALSDDGRTLAVAYDRTDSVRLVDTASGRELHKLAPSELSSFQGAALSVAFSPDGRLLATGLSDSSVRVWDRASGQEISVLGEPLKEWAGPGLQDSPGDVTGLVFSPDGRRLTARSDDIEGQFMVRVWNPLDGKQHHSLKQKMGRSLATSPDGQIASSTVYADYTVQLWNVANGEKMYRLEGHSSLVNAGAFSPDGQLLATGSYDETVRLWDVTTGQARAVLRGHSAGVMDVAFGTNGRMLFTASEDGTMRQWDVATGREVGLFAGLNDDSWVVLTAEGFFNASEGGAEHLNLVRGLDVMSIDQVYDALYRPDLVRESLAGDPDGKVAAAAAELDLEKVVATGLPPRVLELRSLDGETVNGDSATVAADIETRDGGLGRIEWRVNGTVQGADSRGLGAAVAAELDTTRVEKRVFLAPGENVVSVVVYNEANLIASEPSEIALTSTQAALSKPALHVLAAGVNDYFDSRLALSYAVSDARALGAALTKAGRGLYEEVNVTYLLDEQVSAEAMSAAFAELGEVVRPHDVFVFFLAGHGKTHDGRYYFLPRDFRYRGEDALNETAISQEQLQGWLAQVPAQKSVLLFDTCESGSLTEEALTRGLEAQAAIERLSRAVGRTTLTASTDTAPALEGYRQHGLFTYTVLEAFAMADHDEDEQVEVHELIGYVDERLPALSEAVFGFRQVPQHSSRGSVFALGRPVAVLSEAEELIPRTPTHVVIAEADVLESSADADSVLETLAAGVLVRVVESAGGWSLVASDGVKLGWLPTSKLLAIQ